MPLPALLGLSALYAGILALIGAVIQFFLVYISKRLLFRFIIFAALAALIVGTYALFGSIMSGLAVLTPSIVLIAFTWVIPSNFLPCLQALLACYVAAWVYSFKFRFIAMMKL